MINLRKAEKRDEKSIMKLVSFVLADYGLKTNPVETDKDLSDIEGFYFKNNGWFAVLIDNEQIIGSYGLYKISESVCELRKMYLMQTHQRQGLGRMMMNDAIDKARKLGYHEIILETNNKLSNAISMYQKYGFEMYELNHLSDRCDFAMRKKI